MSWDLILWRGAPVEEPPEVWEAFCDDRAVKFIQPLNIDEIVRAFKDEYGDDLRVERYDGGTTVLGRGWEGSLADGDKYLHLTCGWGLARDDDWLTQIVRAGLRARCFVYDPQSYSWWNPPEAGWDPESFDVWEEVLGSDVSEM